MKALAALALPRQPPPASAEELRLRAASLVGTTVGELACALGWPLPARPAAAKGFVGQLVEAALGSDVDAHDRPDFVGLGIECKTVPLRPLPGGGSRPAEGTFVCSIAAAEAAQAAWAGSRLQRRLAAVLWVGIEAASVAPLPQRRIVSQALWRPTPADAALLEADWTDLMGAVGAGRGHSLGAHEGRVLQVRPKAAHARVRTLGLREDGPGETLPLGFYLRPAFVGELLQRFSRGAPSASG